MNVRTGLGVVLMAVAAGQSMAEDKPVDRLPDAVAAEAKPAIATDALAEECHVAPACPQPQCWLEASVLAWRFKEGPLNFPVVTTGNPLDPLAGAIGQPGTRVLYGGDGVDYDWTPGFKLSLGTWLGDGPVGVEANVFWLSTADESFNAGGAQPLYLPTFNAQSGREGRLIVNDATAGLAGTVGVDSQSRLWGLDANALYSLSAGDTEATFLAGFRYANLDERLTIRNTATTTPGGAVTAMQDRFETENRFYGGQIGGRLTMYSGVWSFGLSAKLAVGQTRQTVDVTGVTRQSIQPNALPGGFFALPSNIRRETNSEFTVLPELNLRLGVQLTAGIRAFIGYDALYWSNVARPGDQVDRVTNPTQSPVFGGGALIGDARPRFLTETAGFYAQGVSAGLEWRY